MKMFDENHVAAGFGVVKVLVGSGRYDYLDWEKGLRPVLVGSGRWNWASTSFAIRSDGP